MLSARSHRSQQPKQNSGIGSKIALYDRLNSHFDLLRRRAGDRAFLRDVVGWKYAAEDWDNDWLIFKSGPSEMGVHPTHSVWEGKTYDHPRQHSIALMCDDIEATVEELRGKGAQFSGPIEEQVYGRVIMMIVPGADDMQLYKPPHKLAYNLSACHPEAALVVNTAIARSFGALRQPQDTGSEVLAVLQP